MFTDLRQAGRYLGQAMRPMVGMPDYDAYSRICRRCIPTSRDYAEFFRERQEARYGSGAGKCY